MRFEREAAGGADGDGAGAMEEAGAAREGGRSAAVQGAVGCTSPRLRAVGHWRLGGLVGGSPHCPIGDHPCCPGVSAHS